jgi:hypothetical protein
MRFVKIKYKNIEYHGEYWRNKFNESWFLLLTNHEEILKYMMHDMQMYVSTLKTMPRETETTSEYHVKGELRLDHLSYNREEPIGTFASMLRLISDKEEITADDVVGGIIHAKIEGFLQALKIGTLQIKQKGAYCIHEYFMKDNDAKIIDEIIKEDCIFPNEYKPHKSKVLVLENDGRVDKDIEKYAYKIDKSYDGYNSITNLKDQDINWVIESIKLCQNIVFKTKAIHVDQIDKFMKLFSSIEKKNIHIKTENKETIINHELFEINNKIHKIKFI